MMNLLEMAEKEKKKNEERTATDIGKKQHSHLGNNPGSARVAERS